MNIGNRNIKIEPTKFNGKVYVSIREWYKPNPEAENFLPGRKGINLTIDEWNEVVANFDTIKAEIEEIDK